MTRTTVLAVAACAAMMAPGAAARQARNLPLDTAAGLRLVNVSADPVVLDGKKGLRVTVSEEAVRRLKSMPPEEQAAFQTLAVVEGLEFGSGVIEAEIAGAPAPDAGEGARGFVGIAFRLQSDMKSYDTFYLRPTNGRADDQERRNHAVQYTSSPDWPWFRLRKETPSSTRRTSISCRARGRRSRSTSAAIARASTSMARSSRR